MISATQAPNRTIAKGKPVETAIVCNAAKPPPNSSEIATSPSNVAQNTRCGVGALTSPPALMVSITNDPESDEVTKNTMTSTMPIKEVIAVSGRCANISNNWISSAASHLASQTEKALRAAHEAAVALAAEEAALSIKEAQAAMIKAIVTDHAERKSARDLRYANRKAAARR